MIIPFLGYWVVLFWFFIAVLTFIIEAITTELVSIWFVVGSFAAMLFSAFLPEMQIWQIIIFIVASALSFLLLRPLIKKRFIKNDRDIDPNSMIGLTGVTQSKVNSYEGRVLVNGTSWSALSNELIDEGKRIIIEEQNNLVLKVKEIKE